MLTKAKERAKDESISEKCKFIHGNFFNVTLESSYFDSAFVGFLLSHLMEEDTNHFFSKLKPIITHDSDLMIIDSSWSMKRQIYREKKGEQIRKLNDGREFSIFKKYFEQDELQQVLSSYGYLTNHTYFGDAFPAVIAERE